MAGDVMLALDLGTTAAKAVAVDRAGAIVAGATGEYPIVCRAEGWAEQDAGEVCRAALTALGQVCAQLAAGRLAGLCLSGAMHSLLPIAADGLPLDLAMTWADTRAAEAGCTLRARQDDADSLYQRTGCPVAWLYHPARLCWWRQQGFPSGVHRWAALKDVLLYRLTGVWATDRGLASTTGLLDLRRGQWDEAALALAGIGAEMLPALVDSQAVVGQVTQAAASACGLPVGLPVVAGASDGALANLGAGASGPDTAVVTVGTSGAIRAVCPQPQLDPQQRTWCYRAAPTGYLCGGAINSGGMVLQWVRQRFFAEFPAAAGFAAMLEQAATIAPGADGLLLLPYLSGERSPHFDPQFRAALLNMSLAHRRAHIARAALEATAYCLADVWAALPPAVTRRDRLYLTGGIIRAPLWAQIVSDVLARPLLAVEAADASALGAAALGFLALNLADPLRHWPPPAGHLITPNPHTHAPYQAALQRFRSAQRLAC